MRLRDLLDALLRRGRRRPSHSRSSDDPGCADRLPGHRRGAIALGDLLCALHRLEITDDAVAARVHRHLGFAQRDPNPPERLRGAYDQRHAPERRRPSAPAPAPPLGAPPFSGQAPPPSLPEKPLETELTPLDPAPAANRPDWIDAAAPVEASTPAATPRAPLFPRRTATALLSPAVATRRPGAELDLPRIITSLTRGDPMRDLPRLPVAGLDRGLQLLLDVSEAMTPFREDLADLTQALERIVGRERCQVFEFPGDPRTATAWSPAGADQAWKPERGRPVVLATELGIGAPPAARDRASTSAWLDFARQVRTAGCPLVAFVPLPPARWPVRLARQVTLIHWDPRTTAGAVRRLVGAGHEVPA